jgi:hypothetical protein
VGLLVLAAVRAPVGVGDPVIGLCRERRRQVTAEARASSHGCLACVPRWIWRLQVEWQEADGD